MVLFHLYRTPALSTFQTAGLLTTARQTVSSVIRGIETEFCFNVAADSPLSGDEMRLLRWLLSETFEPEQFSDKSFLTLSSALRTPHTLFEVGPRMNDRLVNERGVGLPRLRTQKDLTDRTLPPLPAHTRRTRSHEP
jgi:hypothetical protein